MCTHGTLVGGEGGGLLWILTPQRALIWSKKVRSQRGVEMPLIDKPSKSPEATLLLLQMEVIKPACWQSLGRHTLTKAREAHHCRVLGRQSYYSQKAFPYASERTQFPLPPQGIYL